MPPDGRQPRIERSQLPDEFTPETVRAMGMRTARLSGVYAAVRVVQLRGD